MMVCCLSLLPLLLPLAKELTFYRADTPGQIIIPLDDPAIAGSQTILYKVELRGSRVQWVTRIKYETILRNRQSAIACRQVCAPVDSACLCCATIEPTVLRCLPVGFAIVNPDHPRAQGRGRGPPQAADPARLSLGRRGVCHAV